MPEVCLDHYGATYCNVMTDGMGRFEIGSKSPGVVFRKRGYAPQLVKLPQSENLQVTMAQAESSWPVCEQRALIGCRGLFCFANLKGVRTPKPSTDIDYSMTSYTAHVGKIRASIVHGEGAMWTLGLPSDRDVWDSIEYFERDYFDSSGQRVIDARGSKSDGTHWRYLGTIGESASYQNVKATEVMRVLDQVLDSVCFRLP